MVANTRTTRGAGRLRQLNQPRPVTVEEGEDGEPKSIDGRTIESVIGQWRIEDEWWRASPIDRTYWRLLLEGGRTIDVYRDSVRKRWYRQAYSR